MKAFVVSSGSEVVFAWSDIDFQHYMRNKFEEANDDESDSCTFDLLSCIQAWFSSVAAAYFVLKAETKETFSFIQCENNGFFVCFRTYDKYLYVGVQQADGNHKDQIFREIGFIRSVINWLFGPNGYSNLVARQLSQKKKAWNYVTLLLESYIKLSKNESIFLLEGIQQVQCNDDITNGCKNTVKECILKYLRHRKEKHLHYILLVAGKKMLYCHKCLPQENSLSTSTLLKIIALLHCDISQVKSSSRRSEDVEGSPESERKKSSGSTIAESESPFGKSDYDTYCAPDLDCLIDNEDKMSAFSKATSYSVATKSAAGDNENLISDPNFFDNAYQSDSHDSLSTPVDRGLYSLNERIEEEFDLPYSLSVFASDRKRSLLPCQLSCIPLSDHVNMVIITKVPSANVASTIRDLLLQVKRLEELVEREPFLILPKDFMLEQRIERFLNDLCSKTKSLAKDVKESCEKLRSTWQTEGRKSLKSCLSAHSNISSFLGDLRRSLKNLEHSLLKLFKKLFPCCLTGSEKLISSTDLNQIQTFVKEKLEYVINFVHYDSVKSGRNTTVSSLLTDFPGLVHFAFIQRTIGYQQNDFQDLLFTPHLSMASHYSGLGRILYSILLKDFWSFVENANCLMVDGQQHVVCEKHGFVFMSVVFCSRDFDFEESYNFSLIHKNDFTGLQKSNFVSTSLFCGKFFNQGTGVWSYGDQSSNVIYHLVTVHFNCVPIDIIFQQCKMLVKNHA